MTSVTYGHHQAGQAEYPLLLRQLISERHSRSVCDVGGGAAPALGVDEVEELGIQYTLLDISSEELRKAPNGYLKVQMDISAPRVGGNMHFDLIQSRMLAEHIDDAETFHRNVFDLLQPGGTAIHMMPTLWDPAFIMNRFLPDHFTGWLIAKLQPNRRLTEDQGKFRAYYRWCRGPSADHIRRFEAIGYEVISAKGYFGTDYAKRLPFVGKALEGVTNQLLAHPVAHLTSYCILILRKPQAQGAGAQTDFCSLGE